MTLHFSDRQWGGASPRGGRGGARYGHRTDGYRQAQKAWICTDCRAFHQEKRLTCAMPVPVAGKEDAPCPCGDFFYCDSKGEALHFLARWRLQDYGEIRAGTLEHHPRYPLFVPGPDGKPVRFAIYEADLTFVWDATGQRVVEDFKPGRKDALDPVFKLKKRAFEAQYGLEIDIVSN